MSSQKNLVWSAAILALILIAGALIFRSQYQGDSAQKDASSKVVRIASFSSAVDYAPYLVAREKGWFDEALAPLNARAEYSTFQSLAPINEALASQRVDVVFEAEPPAIIGKAAGVDVKIAALSCTLKQTILVSKDGPIQTISELKGKKIAVLTGTSSHYGVFQILKSAGLSASDVSIVDMPPAEAKSAFESGSVDAWAVWPPFVEQEVLSGKGRVLEGGDAFVNSIVAMRQEFISANRPQAEAIVATVARSKQWIESNPREAQEIVARQLDVPLAVIEAAWPVHNWGATLTDSVQDDIQAKADFLWENGSISNKVNVRSDLIQKSL